MPRPKQRTPELREHVLQVALSLLATEGPAGLTARRVAEQASTSTPAVYELFGDKAGLVRELFFEGFARLRVRLDELAESDDPRRDLEAMLMTFRRFVQDNPVLAQVMFSRPFGDFDPSTSDRAAGDAVRSAIVGAAGRAVRQGVLVGNESDIAHVVLAVAQGLAAQEAAGWLGSSPAALDRRWQLGIRATLDGLAPAP